MCGLGEVDLRFLPLASCHHFLGLWRRDRPDSLVPNLDFVFVLGDLDDGVYVCCGGVFVGREAVCEFGAGALRGSGAREEKEVSAGVGRGRRRSIISEIFFFQRQVD